MEKQWKKHNGELSTEKTIEEAIFTLENVSGLDFKPKDLEIGVVSMADQSFRKLTHDEIDKALSSLNDQ